MLCKFCDKDHNNKTFCSKKCRNAWIKKNNLCNNPIRNPRSLGKMRKALTGRKLDDITKSKMSETRKRIVKQNPVLIQKMLSGAEEKYLSKIRGTGWRQAREKALARDNYKCQKCGLAERLLVHHINYKGRNLGSQKDMDNRLDNLVTLCHKCHNRLHRHKSKDYRKRMKENSAII